METTNIVASEYSLESKPEGKASVKKHNPYVTYAKFTFTDDLKNKNNQRIPKEEFANVIKSGKYMPIKMEQANIQGSHENSTPIGVITALKEQDNKVIGIAALWEKERPEAVEKIKTAFAEGTPLDLSWEVLYGKDSSNVDDSGTEVLKDVTVRGITFVGNPAYDGRTNVYALAETQLSQEEMTLAEINLQELEASVANLTEKATKLEADLAAATSELETVRLEAESLRQFKAEREASDAKASLIATRKTAWSEAKLSTEEFEARSERIAGMDDESFKAYVEDLVAFSSKNTDKGSNASATAGTQVPDVTSTETKDAKAILLGAFK